LKQFSFFRSKNAILKPLCQILDLERSGTNGVIIDRILEFLLKPEDSGKRLPVTKKRRPRKAAE